MRLGEIKPQFVLVMGGAGSGKNWYISHDPVISRYTLIDVDAVKLTTDLSSAIGMIKPMLIAAFEGKENVAHPTTGSNLKGQQNKIALAQHYGYGVTIVLKDTPIDQAIAQVRKRYRDGGHDVELEAIVNSNKRARENFESLKHLADKAIVVQ
jgi:predicted ABC-type ATPase